MSKQTEVSIWSDDPSEVDLLSFRAVADTLGDVLLDRDLDPVAIGLSGPWGSGKTTVLNLLGEQLESRSTREEKVLVVSTDPWRYDPVTGVKESLIDEVLGALKNELEAVAKAKGNTEKVKNGALKLLKTLAKRVDWSRALKMAAKSSITLQLPKLDDVLDLVRDGAEPETDEARTLDSFRDEFAKLIADDSLSHVKRVVVLIDDLDRCIDETVVETLEAIRLFLAVPGMSFVLAADEDRVAAALSSRFADDFPGVVAEKPSRQYLHKIVQTTVPVPTLSQFDTAAYILLLLIARRRQDGLVERTIAACEPLRLEEQGAQKLAEIVTEQKLDDEYALTEQLTPILYEEYRGNPRRIKRFLNDIMIRQAIASRRGVTMKANAVAKLMVLENLLKNEFKTVVGWLAEGKLDEKLGNLTSHTDDSEAERGSTSETADASQGSVTDGKPETTDPEVTLALKRWVRMAPELRGSDISSYLTLAASFAGIPVIASGLPVHLRVMVAKLTSPNETDRRAVKPDDISALSPDEASLVVMRLGAVMRDEQARQNYAIESILTIGELRTELTGDCIKALKMMPGRDLGMSSAAAFMRLKNKTWLTVLEHWRDTGASGGALTTINRQLRKAGSDGNK